MRQPYTRTCALPAICRLHAILPLALLSGLLSFLPAAPALAQSCMPAPAGIIAWWPFDETSGTTAQDIIGGNAGTYVGNPMPAAGQVGGSLQFDGADDYLVSPDSDVWAFGASDFTIEFWANFNTAGDGTAGHPGDVFIGNDEGPFIVNKWFFALGGGHLEFVFSTLGERDHFLIFDEFAPAPGQWYHLAVRRQGDTFTAYVDGVEAGSVTDDGVIPIPDALLAIGRALEPFGGFFGGRLDEIAIYNRALSDLEIQVIFNAGGAGKCKELRIVPDHGGTPGTVTVEVHGSGFMHGSVVSLQRSGQPDTISSASTVEAEGSIVSALFDLSDTAKGTWDVVVTFPDGRRVVLNDGFTVEEAKITDIFLDIVGLNIFRPSQSQSFFVVVENRGNTDAIGVPVWIRGIPPDAGWELRAELTPPDSEIDWTDAPIAIENGADIALPLLLARAAAGHSYIVELRLSVPSEAMTLLAWANDPLLEGESIILALQGLNANEASVLNCVSSIAISTINVLGYSPLRTASCGQDVAFFVTKKIKTIADFNRKQSILSTVQLFSSALLEPATFTNCAGSIPGPVGAVARAVGLVLDGASTFIDCRDVFQPKEPAIHQAGAVTSFDPNEKAGSTGATSQKFVASAHRLRYAVFFENLASASAPARDVVISDQIDRALVRSETFSLGPIAFGDRLVTPPSNSRTFATNVDLRPQQNLIVHVEAAISEETGLIMWRLSSVDPATGLPPEDPLAGFLPPNVNSPEGEGSVLFTVQPKPGLETGTEILNDAEIIFDTNEPIRTPVWFNTIDNSNPTSEVALLNAVQETLSFEVAWSGEDEGAGIRDFSVFVAEEGGPFEPWLINTPDTVANFVGEDGGSYEFYSLARDLTGNVEEKEPGVEAETLVQLPPADRDGDGVPDDEDACRDSIVTATVVIDDCDSGVPNTILDEGCTISDRIAQWAAEATNHGQFVRRVTELTNRLRNNGIITGQQGSAIQRCAAQADLP